MEPVDTHDPNSLFTRFNQWLTLTVGLNSKLVLLIVMIGLLITLWMDWRVGSKKKAENITTTQSESTSFKAIDTHIPQGFSLVPIEVQNAVSLNSIVGAYAIVDLFEVKEGQKAERVAYQVRLIRAPLDPSQFAVLIDQSQAQKLMGYQSALYAAVQNPKALRTPPIKFKKIPDKSRIFIENLDAKETN